MYGCQCMTLKEIIIIFILLITCSIIHNPINATNLKKSNKYYSTQTQKMFFEKKLQLIENLRIKSLTILNPSMKLSSIIDQSLECKEYL